MATAKRKSSNERSGSKSRAARTDTTAGKDAIELLKADHRAVERYFADFAKSEDRKQ